MSKVLRVGVAGLGEAATEFLPGYNKHPHIALAACADTRKPARDRFEKEFGAKSYASIEEMCKAKDLDAIVVATNHEFHRDPCLWAAQNGKHVIVEKPMALTLEDCDVMIEACEKHGVLLLGGHNHSYDAPIRKMRQLVKSGELGELCMINSWNFNDFMVRPYPDSHIEESRGVVLNQGAHHVDVIRLIGGGMLRSVRAMCGKWGTPNRPGEGAYSCYLEFEDGTPVTLVYSGYGFLDTAEFFGWWGEGGQPRQPWTAAVSRSNFLKLDNQEREDVVGGLKERLRYGNVGLGERAQMPAGWEKGGRPPVKGKLPTKQPFFGLTVVSCSKGDVKQTPEGLMVYGDERREIPITDMTDAREAEIDELYNGVVHGKPLIHDGKWGKASIEVCLAMLQSTVERREILLKHQVPVRD